MLMAYECARLAQGQLLVCVLEVNRNRVHVVTFFILLILSKVHSSLAFSIFLIFSFVKWDKDHIFSS